MSLTWSAVYLRGEVPPDFPLPTEGPVEVRTLGGWTELGLRALIDPVSLARAVSGRVSGDVVAVQAQSTATVISVVHCEGGEERRRLDFADGTWVAVRGTPKPWERAMYRPERLADALEDHEDEAGVRAAFEKADVREGDALPWPGILDNLVQALGVTEQEWAQTRATAPRAVLQGTRTSRLTWVVRGGAVVTLALLAGAVSASRDARGLFAMFAGMALLATSLGAFLRRVQVGRWIF